MLTLPRPLVAWVASCAAAMAAYAVATASELDAGIAYIAAIAAATLVALGSIARHNVTLLTSPRPFSAQLLTAAVALAFSLAGGVGRPLGQVPTNVLVLILVPAYIAAQFALNRDLFRSTK